MASFVGCAAGGPFLDWLTRRITKRRGGYFVPEYRLWAMIPPSIMFPAGLLMYGGGLENHLHYMIPIVGSAIGYAIVCVVPSIGMTYVLDCYRPLSGETMTMVTAAKNVLGFAISFAAFPWLARDGYLKVSRRESVVIFYVADHLRHPVYKFWFKVSSFSRRFQCTSMARGFDSGLQSSSCEVPRPDGGDYAPAATCEYQVSRTKIAAGEFVGAEVSRDELVYSHTTCRMILHELSSLAKCIERDQCSGQYILIQYFKGEVNRHSPWPGVAKSKAFSLDAPIIDLVCNDHLRMECGMSVAIQPREDMT